jgi:hypothetical protein
MITMAIDVIHLVDTSTLCLWTRIVLYILLRLLCRSYLKITTILTYYQNRKKEKERKNLIQACKNQYLDSQIKSLCLTSSRESLK